MVAFVANSWKAVNEFHAAAVANGGSSEGEPGLRLQYNPDFYAAYVRDPHSQRPYREHITALHRNRRYQFRVIVLGRIDPLAHGRRDHVGIRILL
jgi:hypothetical protein